MLTMKRLIFVFSCMWLSLSCTDIPLGELDMEVELTLTEMMGVRLRVKR